MADGTIVQKVVEYIVNEIVEDPKSVTVDLKQEDYD